MRMLRLYLLLLLLLALVLFGIVQALSSQEPGCVNSDQFDNESHYVDSKPESDGIYGDNYDNTSGGQIAAWHETGVRTNGEPMILYVKGAWTAWEEGNGQNELTALPRCRICIKKSAAANCLCADGEIPAKEFDTKEFGQINTFRNIDCSTAIDQNDPEKCTCTTNYGSISDPETYQIALNYQYKDETLKIPDEQNACRYSAGEGLYIGLFGKDNSTTPLRAYHMSTTETSCPISLDAQNQCIDAEGNDATNYIYRSPNDKIFIKDAKGDLDSANDEYHEYGEYVKFIINDRYYNDNYGGYNITFIDGFIRSKDDGLLEYIVGTVEDAVLGKIDNDTGKRGGGAIAFLYNSIVKDSVFILIVQLCLILYVTFFGIGVLSGMIEISRKEMVKRIVKIGIIILFTTETSWYFYNQIVVGFFKDGMDNIITIFMDSSDKIVDQTSLIITSQLDRASSASHATRFSYVDEILKKIFSSSVSKKIWGLFFGEFFFGPLYIAIIYGLIFSFAYIMLFAAFQYVQILLGLVFALALGPLFMITMLFNKTDEIFKRWLVYLASQSLQIIFLFLVIYLFAILIDKGFENLLYYRVCTEHYNLILFESNIYMSDGKGSILVWFAMFIELGALLFLLKLLIEKIPGFAGHLTSIKFSDSTQNADTSKTYLGETNAAASSLAGDLLGKARSAAMTTLGGAAKYGYAGAKFIDRESGLGLSKSLDELRAKSPFRDPIKMYNDRQVDKIIKDASAKHKGEDAKIRAKTMEEARKKGYNDSRIIRRLEQKLVIDPFSKFIQDESKKLNQNGIISKSGVESGLDDKIGAWAKKNSSLNAQTLKNLLRKDARLQSVLHNAMPSSGMLATLEAAGKTSRAQNLQALQEWGEYKPNSMYESMRNKLGHNAETYGANYMAKIDSEKAYMANEKSYFSKMIDQSYAGRLIYADREKIKLATTLAKTQTEEAKKSHETLVGETKKNQDEIIAKILTNNPNMGPEKAKSFLDDATAAQPSLDSLLSSKIPDSDQDLDNKRDQNIALRRALAGNNKNKALMEGWAAECEITRLKNDSSLTESDKSSKISALERKIDSSKAAVAKAEAEENKIY
ncbi:MAG: type IV secretory pathway VirB6-like protein/DNA-directed RNA polymerase subunit F [Rickettsiales bacterium]|jgi:type IV secretory pathway VirB6-like protein/DNA-directed RNA polymerase subunit F